jgi:hypothetical protein
MSQRSRIGILYPLLTLVIVASLAWLVTLTMKKKGPATVTSAPASRPVFAESSKPAPLVVSGTVVDDLTGSPIPDFTVTYGDFGHIPFWQHENVRSYTKGRFTYELPSYFDFKEFGVQVQAKGYKAAASRLVRRTESAPKLEFRLVPPERLAGVVRAPDGNPVAGAAVRVVTPGNYLRVSGGLPSSKEPLPPGNHRRVVKTDDAGRFEVDVDCEHCRIIVLHELGFADFTATQAARKSPDVSLQPWGVVKCDVILDGKPAVGATIFATWLKKQQDTRTDAHVDFETRKVTDAKGRCTLTHVRPGETVVAIYEPFDIGRRDSYWGSRSVRDVPLKMPAGAQVNVHIGGGGAEVIGRFTAGARKAAWEYAIARLRRPWPEGVAAPPPVDLLDDAMMRRDFPVEVKPDGTFRATDIPPGDWRIDAMVFVERKGEKLVHHAGDLLKRFSVPPPAADGRASIVDLEQLQSRCSV